MKRSSLALLVVLGGCQEPPSWAVRWRIEPRPDMELEPMTTEEGTLLNSVQCSRVGVSVIEFSSLATPLPECESFDKTGCDSTTSCQWVPGNPSRCLSGTIVADVREKPCFSQPLENPRATLGGATLAPGPYELIARGVRSNGAPWVECFVADDGMEYCGDERLIPRCLDTDDGPRCQEGYVSCDCRFMEAIEDETQHFDDLVLAAPPECQDGIDSDGDGLVDQRDPGCQGGNREDVNVVNAQIVFDFSLLSHHPLASCAGVGLSQFVVSLDDEEVGRTPCRIGAFGLNLDVEPGPHVIAVEALAFDGSPRTRSQTFGVVALAAGVIEPSLLEVDFADADFLEPIEALASFSVGFAPDEEDITRYCVGGPGELEIAEITVRLLDAGGGELSPAPRAVAPEEFAGVRLDGRPMTCISQAIITRPLTWGAYRVAVEGFSPAGDLCFSNVDEPTLLAPGTGVSVRAPRVLPLAASCRDCNGDAACGESGYVCDEGVCVPG